MDHVGSGHRYAAVGTPEQRASARLIAPKAPTGVDSDAWIDACVVVNEVLNGTFGQYPPTNPTAWKKTKKKVFSFMGLKSKQGQDKVNQLLRHRLDEVVAARASGTPIQMGPLTPRCASPLTSAVALSFASAGEAATVHALASGMPQADLLLCVVRHVRSEAAKAADHHR